MPELPAVTTWAIPIFILLVVLEWVSFRLHPDDEQLGYSVKDTATSLSMGIGSIFWDLLWKLPILAGYLALYEASPFKYEFEWWHVLLVLVAQDFFFYWSHRCHHIVRVLWASHVVHHSSQRFNLSTALRQPWTGLTSAIFYVPLIVAGVQPSVLFFVQGVNLLYQFWIHTERIGTLARPVEFILNTPSHHRVHHAANGSYLDRNFGGMLIVWDRMFGTFEAETIRCQYGLTKNISTYNPLRVAYHEYAAIARDVREASRWRDRMGHIFRGPGWTPDQAIQRKGPVDIPVD
jgi:sterol desaturase/sphingolipid hydroxylase (fatty acid hydroxylase superfamily)